MPRLSQRNLTTALTAAEVYRACRDLTKEEAARLAAERFGWMEFVQQIVDAMQD